MVVIREDVNSKEWTLEELGWVSCYYNMPFPFEKMSEREAKLLKKEHFKLFGFERSAKEIHDKWCELNKKY